MEEPAGYLSAVCFGEILWDVLPDVKKPGGAPMNVAYHLNVLGLHTDMVSAVGKDEDGTELLNFLERKGLNTDYIQRAEMFPTGLAIASEGANHEMTYDIVAPAAWDKIRWTESLRELVTACDALIFGSLGLRDSLSRETLTNLLSNAHYSVFDVNLRPPHYSLQLIDMLLRRIHLLKVNEHELPVLAHWFGSTSQEEQVNVDILFEAFPLKEILLTKGKDGASYFTRDGRVDQPAIAIEVVDTIGSGDSFLAAFLSQKFQGASPKQALQYAAGMGAFIASHAGACPEYTPREFEQFLKEKLA